MEGLRYLTLLLAVLVGLLLLVRPRWGLLAMIPLFPFLYRFIPSAGSGINAETGLFLAAVAGMLLHARSFPPVSVIGPFVGYYTCALFGFALLATWPDLHDHVAFDALGWVLGLKSNLWSTLLFFPAFALGASAEYRRWAYTLLCPVVLIYALSGYIDYLSGVALDEQHRAAGLLSANPNTLGAAIAILSIAPLSRTFARDASMPARVLTGLIYVIGLGALLLTRSRGAWLAFLVGNGTWLLMVRPRLFFLAAPSAVVLLIGAYSLGALPKVVSERIEETLAPSQTFYRAGALASRLDASAASRLVFQRMAFDMFLDSPVWGHGYRSFGLLAPDYGPRYGVFGLHPVKSSSGEMVTKTPVTENDTLNVMVDNGLIGLAVFAWMGLMLLSYGRAVARHSSPEREVGVAFLAMFGGIATASLTQQAMLVHEIAIPFWLMAGLVIRADFDRRLAGLAHASSRNEAPADGAAREARVRTPRYRPGYAFEKN